MKKKIAKLMLGTMFLTGVLSGCGSNTKETAGGDNNGNKYDLTLYSINTTDADFGDWLKNVDRFGYTSTKDNHYTFYR